MPALCFASLRNSATATGGTRSGGRQRRRPPGQRHMCLASSSIEPEPDAEQPAGSRPSGSSPDNAPASSSSSSSGSSGGGIRSVSQKKSSPWELMGRVLREERIALQFDTQLNQGLVRSAAARESGLEYDEFEERLQRLLALMPFLQARLLRMSPKLLAALAVDPPLIAARLIQLKALLPAADVAAIAGARPSLLLAPEWERLPAAAAALGRHYSEEDAARLAAAEPLLLAEDVDAVLEELERLAVAGGDARAMLLRDPSMVYCVQRGTKSLGPGAEF